MLSCLPLSETSNTAPNAINAKQIGFMPITASQLKDETPNDRVLKQIHEFCISGKWPNTKEMSPKIKPY